MPFENCNAAAVFSTRERNFRREKIDPAEYRKNISGLAHRLSVNPEKIFFFNQVHGSKVITLDSHYEKKQSEECSDADGGLTERHGAAIAIVTADCAPLFLLDTEGSSTGLLHVGWKGAKKGIINEAFARLKSSFNCDASDMIAGLGPMIRQCCYEVGSEFVHEFPGFVAQKSCRHFFDLAGFIRAALIQNGVKENHVYDSGLCTVCRSDLFFSYRREGPAVGRICSAVVRH